MSAVGTRASIGRKAGPQIPLKARCLVHGSARVCRLLDLDTRRAFVESFLPPVTGSQVSLEFRLPNGHQVSAAGRVNYHQIGVGFGVDLTDLTASDREEIARAAS